MNRIESNGTNELRGIYEHYRLHEKAFLFLLHVSYEEAYEQHPDWFTNCVLLDLTCEQLVTFVEAARVTEYSLCADQIQGFRSDDQFVLLLLFCQLLFTTSGKAMFIIAFICAGYQKQNWRIVQNKK